MNNTPIPEDKIAKFQDSLMNDLLFQLFTAEFSLADEIEGLKELQADPVRVEQLAGINDRLKEANEEKKKCQNVLVNSKKQSEKMGAKMHIITAEGVIQKILMEKSRLINPLNDLYRQISAAAEKVRNLKKSIDFATKYSRDDATEQLPYAELDGTKYAMNNNILEKSSVGQMVLYVENKNDTNNTTETTQEA